MHVLARACASLLRANGGSSARRFAGRGPALHRRPGWRTPRRCEWFFPPGAQPTRPRGRRRPRRCTRRRRRLLGVEPAAWARTAKRDGAPHLAQAPMRRGRSCATSARTRTGRDLAAARSLRRRTRALAAHTHYPRMLARRARARPCRGARDAPPLDPERRASAVRELVSKVRVHAKGGLQPTCASAVEGPAAALRRRAPRRRRPQLHPSNGTGLQLAPRVTVHFCRPRSIARAPSRRPSAAASSAEKAATA